MIHCGKAIDRLQSMPSDSVDCCVTSPPYWGLRDYGAEGQIGLEPTPSEWCDRLVAVFREVRRVLKPTGTLWLNVGDSYISKTPPSGIKLKDMVGQPWMLAFALRADGWYLRRDIIWHKPNCMPESAKDRPTTAHEYVFLLSKSERYFYDPVAIMEKASGTSHSRGSGVNPKAVSGWDTGPGLHNVIEFSRRKAVSASSRMRIDRDPASQTPAKIRAKQNRSFSAAVSGVVETRNARSVWSIPTAPYRGAHFATFPARLAERCILAGTSAGGSCPLCGEPWVRSGSTWVSSCPCSLAAEPSPAVVLDPFAGAGTTLMVAHRLGRAAVGIEINPEYVAMAEDRLARDRAPSGSPVSTPPPACEGQSDAAPVPTSQRAAQAPVRRTESDAQTQPASLAAAQ